LNPLRERAKARPKGLCRGPEEEEQIRREVSELDKRRALYLKIGGLDQGRIGRMPVKLFSWVFGKSRDEIEHCFIKMERCLNPRELKTYAYVIFDLQRFFTESLAKKVPQGLDQSKMDQCFLEQDSFIQDYVRDFMDARRAWRAPPSKSSVTLEEASDIFGVKKDVLKTMTRRGLARLYRRICKKVHPDKGGTEEQFVKLTEAYRELLKGKGKPTSRSRTS